jgi:quinol monooxygenase YgiN
MPAGGFARETGLSAGLPAGAAMARRRGGAHNAPRGFAGRSQMIVITGGLIARPDSIAEATLLGIEHSRRSRAEPGCLAHNIHVDAENPLRLMFYEEWQDADAVRRHFVRPESLAFVRRFHKLAASRLPMKIYDTSEIEVTELV